MHNPFERAPADGNSGGGLAKKRFKVEKLITEAELRAEQLDLVRRWRKHQILWNPNENGNRLRPDKSDVEYYHERRRGHRGTGMYGSEGAAFAEYMVLETLDAEGVLGGKHSVTEGHAYAYEPSDIDDILRGTDALILYTGLDEENERTAFPVAVDVTLNPEEATVKQMRDLERLVGKKTNLARLYWYDTRELEAGTAWDEPGEGKIRALNTTVFVPGELADAFVSPSSNSIKAKEALQRVGAIALDQQRWQLELEALLLTGGIRLDPNHGLHSIVNRPTRSQVMYELNQLLKRGSPEQDDRVYAAKALSEILPTIWMAWADHPLTRNEQTIIDQTRLTRNFNQLENDLGTKAAGR